MTKKIEELLNEVLIYNKEINLTRIINILAKYYDINVFDRSSSLELNRFKKIYKSKDLEYKEYFKISINSLYPNILEMLIRDWLRFNDNELKELFIFCLENRNTNKGCRIVSNSIYGVLLMFGNKLIINKDKLIVFSNIMNEINYKAEINNSVAYNIDEFYFDNEEDADSFMSELEMLEYPCYKEISKLSKILLNGKK